MKLTKINLNKVEVFLAKLPRLISEHAFLAFIFLLCVVFILTGFVFYGYKTAVASPVSPGEDQLKFDQKNYQRVLQEWQKRNEKIKNTGSKQYPNPFAH